MHFGGFGRARWYPKLHIFLVHAQAQGSLLNLWSLKGWTGLDWDPTYGPFHFHLSISRFLTERGPKTFIVFRAPLSKTLLFTSFGTPLAQKTFNLPGFEASWVLPAPSGPFLEPPVAFPGRPGGSEVLWGLLVLPGPSWGFLRPPEAFWGSPWAFWDLLGLPVRPGVSAMKQKLTGFVDAQHGSTFLSASFWDPSIVPMHLVNWIDLRLI